jgi:hypothetical protein
MNSEAAARVCEVALAARAATLALMRAPSTQAVRIALCDMQRVLDAATDAMLVLRLTPSEVVPTNALPLSDALPSVDSERPTRVPPSKAASTLTDGRPAE